MAAAAVLVPFIGVIGLGSLGLIAYGASSGELGLGLGLGLFYGFIAAAASYSLWQWVKRADPVNPAPPRSAKADLLRLLGAGAVGNEAGAPRPVENVVAAQSAVTRPANPSRTPVRSSATGEARQAFEEAVDRTVIDREIDIPNATPAQASTLLRAAVRHVDTGGGLGIDVSYSSLGALSTIVPSAVEYLAGGRLASVVLVGVGAHHLSTVQEALISASGTANWCGVDELTLRAADEYEQEHAGDQPDDAAGD